MSVAFTRMGVFTRSSRDFQRETRIGAAQTGAGCWAREAVRVVRETVRFPWAILVGDDLHAGLYLLQGPVSMTQITLQRDLLSLY